MAIIFMIMENEYNEQLVLAREYVEKTSVNIFLTGKAGTGKTTFLKDVVANNPKRKIVLAPTGVAALNAGGATLHSFFQLPFGLCLPNYNHIQGGKKEENFRFNKTKLSIIRSLELLIIDEISMVRADMLDEINNILKKIRRNSKPFGGVQVLLIGDMQQLSPVVKEEDRQILKQYYPSFYFFDSEVYRSSDFVCIELKKIYRQSDKAFIDLLAKVRENKIDREVLETLNNRYQPSFNPSQEEGYIILCTHNYSANDINIKKIEELESKEFTFNSRVEGNFPHSMFPQEEVLTLKKGSQVMFTKNDSSLEKRFVNGTLGVVSEISTDSITVMPLSGEDMSPINVEIVFWENISYNIDHKTKEIALKIEGFFYQYPLKLAWAITIHKSQGLTFDKAIIDAGRSFSHGQVYVAFSRCRSLEGIVLSSQISMHSVVNDSLVSDFGVKSEDKYPTSERLEEDCRRYYRELITEIFDCSKIEKCYYSFAKFSEMSLHALYPNIVKLWEEKRAVVRDNLSNVSIRFIRTLPTLVGDNYVTDDFLQERVRKASDYFINIAIDNFTELINVTSKVDVDNKEDSKVFKRLFKDFVTEVSLKLRLWKYSSLGFNMESYMREKAVSLLAVENLKIGKRFSLLGDDKKEDVSEEVVLPDVADEDLFSRVRKWRNDKAKENNAPAYTVMHQKTLINMCNAKPTTAEELMNVKGIGKKFIEKYGEEVLSLLGEKGFFD
ncbi:MAG: HRDC domain-containing protein [Bacteroidetes bacterium]|nr:HRDC domain-containing protein [Bacteroidota bacterium]